MAYRTQKTYYTPLKLLIPTTEKVNGVIKKNFPALAAGVLIYGSFKTYGGTETTVNGLYSIEDTATVETWYRPDITAACRIATETGAIYEIINEPENVEMRNQTLIFKVKRVKGGA